MQFCTLYLKTRCGKNGNRTTDSSTCKDGLRRKVRKSTKAHAGNTCASRPDIVQESFEYSARRHQRQRRSSNIIKSSYNGSGCKHNRCSVYVLNVVDVIYEIYFRSVTRHKWVLTNSSNRLKFL